MGSLRICCCCLAGFPAGGESGTSSAVFQQAMPDGKRCAARPAGSEWIVSCRHMDDTICSSLNLWFTLYKDSQCRRVWCSECVEDGSRRPSAENSDCGHIREIGCHAADLSDNWGGSQEAACRIGRVGADRLQFMCRRHSARHDTSSRRRGAGITCRTDATAAGGDETGAGHYAH